MGVYIPNWEKPKSCDECWAEYAYEICNSHSDCCPLVPVPPHGRLIDADALIESFDPSDFWNPDAEDNCFAAVHVVNCAPTIIAEEGE